ncbi:class I adenylate-forming enzyme family protein [Limnoraphis robusta]|uniref:class I adenylate-forming enzyme family protein n=1 Tax=Limnoraphis robusta TaxID=1118279 RepID=UPI00066B70B8|nr:class I adenylate-forming enzyme family protein [Limnoraphis robusta]
MKQGILVSLLRKAAERWPEQVYLDGEKSYSYTEAISTVYQLAKQLESAGVKRWDRVLIFTQNRPEIVLALFAANLLGATATILHEATAANSLQKISSQLEPKVIFLDPTTREKGECFSGCLQLDIAAIKNFEPQPLTETLQAFDEMAFRVNGIDTDPALIIYTSGSTGSPRGVVLTQDNVLFVVEKIQARLRYSSEDAIGLFLPLSFDYGLYQAFLAAQVGARLVVNRSEFAGPALLGTLRQQKITILPGIPNLFESLIRILERRQQTLPEIRLITNTGAHLSPQHIERLKNILPNGLIYPMYGLTECKRVSILTPEEAEKHPGSVGRPLDNTQAFIVDEAGNLLPPGEVGELVICGRHVALGYWKAPMETEVRYRTHPLGIGRALYTGDDFQMDEAGYLYFVGRRDAQIKRRGFRIHPLEIETAALEIEGVKDASVVQIDDHLALFVVGESDVSEKMILSTLSRVLESYKIPDSVEILDRLPSTYNGKVDRRMLVEMKTSKLLTKS